MPRFIIGIFFILLTACRLHAQMMSMEEAISATLAHYPTLAAQQAALEAVRINAQVIKDNRLPNVRLHDQVNMGTANGLSGSYFSLGLIVPTAGFVDGS